MHLRPRLASGQIAELLAVHHRDALSTSCVGPTAADQRGRAVQPSHRCQWQRRPQQGARLSHESATTRAQHAVDLRDRRVPLAEHGEESRDHDGVNGAIGKRQRTDVRPAEEALPQIACRRRMPRPPELRFGLIDAHHPQAAEALGEATGIEPGPAAQLYDQDAIGRWTSRPERFTDPLRVIAEEMLAAERVDLGVALEETGMPAQQGLYGRCLASPLKRCHLPDVCPGNSHASTVAVTTWMPVAPSGTTGREVAICTMPCRSVARTPRRWSPAAVGTQSKLHSAQESWDPG